MNKILSKLKNKYNTNPLEFNHLHYKKQRNYGVNLLNKTKKEYYTNLDSKIIKLSGKISDHCFLINKKNVRGILY